MSLDAFTAPEVQSEIQQHIERIAELERKCMEWERWYEGVVADFSGLTTDKNDPDRLHDWEWMDEHRPAPKSIEIHIANG